jgi:putative flippase GtrA
LLNCGGVYAFTEKVGTSYLISKVMTSMLVGFLYNFPLHRYFVFTVQDLDKTAPREQDFAL